MQLEGRCALVTGSVSGLGYAMARRFALEGANVILHGLEPEEQALRARDALQQECGRAVLLHRADLRRPREIEALMEAGADVFGPVDIVVNNAVVRHFTPVESLPPEHWDESLAVNLSAAFHTTRLALPAMLKQGWGRIINMSSVYGFGAAANRIGYVTTKTAIIGMTRAIAMETATRGITCNAIAPGTVPTPAITERIAGLARKQGLSVDEAAREYLSERQPTGRFVAMDHVAALALFLCSEAGQDITGAVLPMDGGWTAR